MTVISSSIVSIVSGILQRKPFDCMVLICKVNFMKICFNSSACVHNLDINDGKMAHDLKANLNYLQNPLAFLKVNRS